MLKYTVFLREGDLDRVVDRALSWGNAKNLGHGIMSVVLTAHNYKPGGGAYAVSGAALSAEDAEALARLFPELTWIPGHRVRDLGKAERGTDMAYVLGYSAGNPPAGLRVVPATPVSPGRLVLWQVFGNMGDILAWVKEDESRTLITGPEVSPEVVEHLRVRPDITWTRGRRGGLLTEVVNELGGYLNKVPTYRRPAAPTVADRDTRWELFVVALDDAAILEILTNAGIISSAGIKQARRRLTDLTGIGPARAKKIEAAMQAAGV